ncbi:hypothetical protein Tco_0839380 [Tanacetum coccineum]|uniref:Uncharacterized protein n=1 Tax=Tanacetum coccineum TaxID=301880 RepID=A0ABQ5AUG1_9ASTR
MGYGSWSSQLTSAGQIKILPPKTAEEVVVRERERKARTTLLMAIPEDHLAKFHKMTDAKEMWNAIKSRFGGNDESKKMQKYILKQQFEGFTVSNSDGIHKGYERFRSLLSQLEIHGSGVSTEDANQKFLRYLPSAWLQGHFARECRTKEDNRRRDGWNPGNKDGSRTGKKEDSKAMVTVDGECVDWTTHSEDDENFAFMASNSSGSNTQCPEPVVNKSNVEVQPKVWSDAPIIEEYESDSDDEHVCVHTEGLNTPSFANKQVKTPRENVKNQSTHSQKPKVNNKELRHGVGSVAFGGSKGYITGKGKIKTGKLDFEDVSFVKELQPFNLFSVSQMCDKKNKVLFTDTECLVLSPDFKLPDENQILLKVPRSIQILYSFNLENIVPLGGLACLIAKATTDES